jgi:subtilisin family serine protease
MKRLLSYEARLLHERVPTIRGDAVRAAGITGRGGGIAILDSGIDGLYNPEVAYPSVGHGTLARGIRCSTS